MGEGDNACSWPNPMPLVCFMSCLVFKLCLSFNLSSIEVSHFTIDRLLYDISGIPNTLNVVFKFPFPCYWCHRACASLSWELFQVEVMWFL